MTFEGIHLRAAQLEQVLSRPDYRRQGLIKILVRRFMEAVQEGGYDLSFIWGIPYYYRQYGYAYAIEGNCYESLPSSRIPDAPPPDGSAYSFRNATAADCQALTDLYRQAMLPYALTLIRTPEHWRYLLEQARFPVELVINARNGEAVRLFWGLRPPRYPRFQRGRERHARCPGCAAHPAASQNAHNRRYPGFLAGQVCACRVWHATSAAMLPW